MSKGGMACLTCLTGGKGMQDGKLGFFFGMLVPKVKKATKYFT